MTNRQAELLTMLHTLKLPAMADAVADLALKAAKANLTHEACTDAALTTTTSSKLNVSTRMWRVRPSTCLPAA
jgi:hypothetical protein